MSCVSRVDLLFFHIRSVLIATILIGYGITRIYDISSNLHIDIWCLIGLSSIVLIWGIVDIVRTIIRIKKSSNFGLPFINSDYN